MLVPADPVANGACSAYVASSQGLHGIQPMFIANNLIPTLTFHTSRPHFAPTQRPKGYVAFSAMIIVINLVTMLTFCWNIFVEMQSSILAKVWSQCGLHDCMTGVICPHLLSAGTYFPWRFRALAPCAGQGE